MAPPLPGNALAGEAGPLLELDAEMLSANALDQAELRAALEESGFEAASQRTWTDPEHDRRALVLVAAFEDPDGAQTYLAWLHAHVGDQIGRASPRTAQGAPDGATIFVHEPSGCCPKESRVYLIPWRAGTTVISLEVSGRLVRPRDVVALAQELDGAI